VAAASHYASAQRYRGLALLGLGRDADAAAALEAALAASRRAARSGSSSSSSSYFSGGSGTAVAAVGHLGAWLALAAAYARQGLGAQSVACQQAAAAQHAPILGTPAWDSLLATEPHDPRRR
jgi:hypothetical protein